MGALKQIGEPRLVSLGSRCLIGRHPGCDLRIDDPRVSGEHASVHWMGDRWELRDLGSRNGTFLDGRRLGAGERAALVRGSTFTLGPDQGFTLVNGAAPVARARHARSGALRTASGGLLVLPDDERPEVSVFEDAGGRWVAEDRDESRTVSDRDIVPADGEDWVLDLPTGAGVTVDAGAAGPTLETIALRFGVSRDEEHVEITLVHEGRETLLSARSHHYLLLTLARARLADRAASPADQGWVDRLVLCRMLATDVGMLNVDVFRARKQLSALGIHGAAGIIARRTGAAGQLRIGIDRVEVLRL